MSSFSLVKAYTQMFIHDNSQVRKILGSRAGHGVKSELTCEAANVMARIKNQAIQKKDE